ncbi:MAG: RNA pyrophosphohydrolase [Legionellales bacterium]|nr:RNA pyrophosphohydrolase [Legionellales bacterium]
MYKDETGFRLNVGIVLMNQDKDVFWGQRIQKDAWQFPQGGLSKEETAVDGMYRELYEEIGLKKEDVEIIAESMDWYSYRIPKQFVRHSGSKIFGQKQKWFLLRLIASEDKICLDNTLEPEFVSWAWVDYWYPIENVIFFKKKVYQKVLSEFNRFFK